MFKTLWKLVRSDERVMQALNQSSVAYDLSPDAPLLAASNNNEPPQQAAAQDGTKPKMWLEDWSPQDEKRLKQPLHWEGYVS